jgi:histidinol-phosphate aminotransferase
MGASKSGNRDVDSCDYFSLALPSVQSLQPYLPGKPIEELQRELGLSNIVKLASNENPLGLSEKVVQAIQSVLKEGARYPDGNGYILKKALVDFYRQKDQVFAINQLTLGNGSNDVLELIARAFVSPSDEVIFSEYAFAVYAIVTQAVGAKAVEVPAINWGHDLIAIAKSVTKKTKLIFLANPNNPTGTAFSNSELISFMSSVPNNVLVVLDEAYGEYIKDDTFPDGLNLLVNYPNLIISRTFSKAWGLASMRVGYAISSPVIADILNRVRQPFNVNLFALVGAAAVLSDNQYIEKGVELNRVGLKQIEDGLLELGLSFIPSTANFIAFNVHPINENCKRAYTGVDIYQLLLKEGVIVRPLVNYKMTDFLRVSIGLPEENQRFLSSLKSVLNALV